MLIDSGLNFNLQPLSLVGGAGVAISSGIVDLMGAGVGVAPPNIIGNATVWGEDAGIGAPRMKSEVLVSTAFTTSNSATLNIAFQGAADSGAGGGYQPGTWVTLEETGYQAVSVLTLGAIIYRPDWPPAVPPNFRPRFLRLLFQPLTATNFTAGAVIAFNTMGRDDIQGALNTPGNFSVATAGF